MLVCRRVISSTFSAVLGLSVDSRDGDYVPGSHTAVASRVVLVHISEVVGLTLERVLG